MVDGPDIKMIFNKRVDGGRFMLIKVTRENKNGDISRL